MVEHCEIEGCDRVPYATVHNRRRYLLCLKHWNAVSLMITRGRRR
jgi:hypothetical protein